MRNVAKFQLEETEFLCESPQMDPPWDPNRQEPMSTDKAPQRRQRQAPLPESLKLQLAGFRSQLWKIKVAEAVLAGFFGILLSYLLVFGLDRLWATPAVVRLGILVGGTSLFVLFAPYWIHRWVFGHRREGQLAKLISQKFPRLGDQLLGVVELQDQVESRESLSPELRAAAMIEVAEEAKGRDFEGALPSSKHRSWSLAVLGTFAIATAALIFVPKVGLNALKRWLMPFSDTPRYTFTRLEEFPKHLIVPFGEAFTLDLRLREDSDNQPPAATARYNTQDPVTASLSGTLYSFAFPGQQARGTVTLKIGDARETITVEPVLRPAAETIAANVRPPDYLGQDPKRIDLRAGVLSVLAGSSVSLEATVSRELATGTLSFRHLPPEQTSGDGEPAAPPEPETLALKVRERSLVSPARTILDTPAEMRLDWTDVLGLGGDDGFRLRIEPIPDQAPSVYIQGIDRQRVLLAEETVEFEILGEDDFGMKEIGIEWRGQFTKPTDASPANGELKLLGGAPDLRRLSEAVAFSPSTLDIPPQKLTVRAYAEDYFPDRGRVYSEPITLFILTRDEHAQLLKTQFDRIIGELEDAARREQNELDENKRLERLDDGKLQEDEGRKRLEQQESNEAENAERMRELAERMEELFKNAARNGELAPDTMKKLAESLENMRELGAKDLPEVEKELKESQDERSDPEQSKKDLNEAIEKQQEALDKMRKTIEQANEANREFEASTFINRLKRAATEEDGIASSLVEHLPGLIGLGIEDVDPSDQRIIGELSIQQRRTASDVRWIQEDLGHFYARTQKEIHKELLTKMQESHIDTALDDNRERIARNESYRSIAYCRKWADQLREWAGKLEGPKEDTGGEGGDGDGEGGEDSDFEFMLKVMQMIQKEQDIRARTRALEQLRRSINQADQP